MDLILIMARLHLLDDGATVSLPSVRHLRLRIIRMAAMVAVWASCHRAILTLNL